jgi:hypothetical protein
MSVAPGWPLGKGPVAASAENKVGEKGVGSHFRAVSGGTALDGIAG